MPKKNLDGRCSVILALCLALGLGCGGKDKGHNRSPIFNTGVGAAVIEPGGGLPSMPPPGSYNRSSRGGAQSQAPSSSASQGGARILSPGGSAYPSDPNATPPPGYPSTPRNRASNAPPPPAYGGGGGMVSIGGATTIDTREEKREMKPIQAMAKNPLLWPVAIVAWPFSKIAGSVSNSANRSQSGGPQSVPKPLSAEEVEQIHDRQQTLAMERALDTQRDGQVAAPPRPAPTPSYSPRAPRTRPDAPRGRWPVSSSPPTIAEELAALRHGIPPESGPSGEPSRSRGPRGSAAPPFSRGARGASAGLRGDRRQDREDPQRQHFDDNGDGHTDREEVYDLDGLIAESAEDADRDGQLDTWTRYRNGAPVRRRADLDGDGLIDAWTYYADGGLDVARLERDTDGDGYRDQIDFFDAGELARRTEDPNGDGLPERVTRFGPDGHPSERDEDSDGDGALDTRSFYQAGRLVRRILLNEDERWEP